MVDQMRDFLLIQGRSVGKACYWHGAGPCFRIRPATEGLAGRNSARMDFEHAPIRISRLLVRQAHHRLSAIRRDNTGSKPKLFGMNEKSRIACLG